MLRLRLRAARAALPAVHVSAFAAALNILALTIQQAVQFSMRASGLTRPLTFSN
jgi:hypothetical protein